MQIAQNTIDTSRIFEQAETFAEQGRALREREGLTGKKILLCCGTMYPKKRQLQVVEAWPRLRELDPDLVLVIVGGGEMLDAVRRTAQEIDPERIHVAGRVPEGEDYVWIAASDLNLFAGGLGLAINQCLAFGKATVVADEPGPDSEILRNGETGWRYERDDVNGMIAAIKHVLDNPDEVARICEQARVMMRDHVTIENMVEKIDGIIRRALGQDGVARTTGKLAPTAGALR